MTDDTELLRLYVEQRSEAAFASLVQRHVDLVYSSALRQTGRHHRAQEVTQRVFSDLARKAATLVRHPVLPAWLHRACRLSALDLLRRERRREGYEVAADADPALAAPAEDTVAWRDLGPVLDEAINGLSGPDRQAVLLRFFSGRGFADIGRELQLSENAARMKVVRALDKLRDRLARRGITSTASALGAALAAQSVAAAPAGLARSVATAAFVPSGGTTAGWLALMHLPKLPLALSGLLLAGGLATVARQEAAASARAAEIDRPARVCRPGPRSGRGVLRCGATGPPPRRPAAGPAAVADRTGPGFRLGRGAGRLRGGKRRPGLQRRGRPLDRPGLRELGGGGRQPMGLRARPGVGPAGEHPYAGADRLYAGRRAQPGPVRRHLVLSP